MPRLSRSNRFVIVFFLGAIALLIALTAHSYYRLAHIERKSGSFLPPGSNGGAPDAWVFRANTFGIGSCRAMFMVSRSEYRSFAPTRESLSSWDDWRGTKLYLAHPSTVRDHGPKLTHWTGPGNWSLLGLAIGSHARNGETTVYLRIPYPVAMLACAMGLALIWFPHRRRCRRAAMGRCIRCGYDLSASREGTCPECGATPLHPSRPPSSPQPPSPHRAPG